MQRFNNILAAVGTRFEEYPALEWAARLAEHNQSKLTIVDVVPEFSWVTRLAMPDHEHTQRVLLQAKTQHLEALAAPLCDRGIDATTKVLSGKTSFEIMREVLRARHDLVVRVTKGAHSRRARFIGTTSMRLLRKCPCPVWLVRLDKKPRFDQVLAAVDVYDAPLDHRSNLALLSPPYFSSPLSVTTNVPSYPVQPTGDLSTAAQRDCLFPKHEKSRLGRILGLVYIHQLAATQGDLQNVDPQREFWG